MTEQLETGKGGSPAATPVAAKPKNRWFGVKNAIAMTVGTGAVAALIFARACGPSGPDRLPVPPVTAPSAPVVVNNCPTPQPNTCNLSLGEHDSQSPNWAPEKCGYCGDNLQQQWETAENCPVDFHCGDGTVQRGAVYGAYIAPSAQGGVYSLGTITVTESCIATDKAAYCQADCPAQGGAPAPATSGGRRTDRRRDTSQPGPVTTTTAPPSGGCDPEVTSRFQNRVSSSLLGNPGAARSAAGATDQTVRARVSIGISNGVPSVSSITLSCPGCSGGSLPSSSVNVGGIPLDRSTTCTTSIGVNIPPG